MHACKGKMRNDARIAFLLFFTILTAAAHSHPLGGYSLVPSPPPPSYFDHHHHHHHHHHCRRSPCIAPNVPVQTSRPALVPSPPAPPPPQGPQHRLPYTEPVIPVPAWPLVPLPQTPPSLVPLDPGHHSTTPPLVPSPPPPDITLEPPPFSPVLPELPPIFGFPNPPETIVPSPRPPDSEHHHTTQPSPLFPFFPPSFQIPALPNIGDIPTFTFPFPTPPIGLHSEDPTNEDPTFPTAKKWPPTSDASSIDRSPAPGVHR